MPRHLTPKQLETLRLIKKEFIETGHRDDPAPSLPTIIARINALRPDYTVSQGTVYQKRDEENWLALRAEYHSGEMGPVNVWLDEVLSEQPSTEHEERLNEVAQLLESAQQVLAGGVGTSAQRMKEQVMTLMLTVLSSLCTPERLAYMPSSDQIRLLSVLRQVDQDVNKNLGLDERIRREAEDGDVAKSQDLYVNLGLLESLIDQHNAEAPTNLYKSNLQKGLEDIDKRNS